MEYVSLLAGEEWSDRPECTHPLLAHEARTTNDLLRESDRARLVPLIARLFGTTEDSPELRARLHIAQARQAVALLEPTSRPCTRGHRACRVGNGPARGRRMVKDLGGLIDVYDEATGDTAREVSTDEVRELAGSLG